MSETGYLNVAEIFGENVFNDAVMQERRNARSAQRSAFGAGSMPHIHISLSHDGPIASAVVTISVE